MSRRTTTSTGTQSKPQTATTAALGRGVAQAADTRAPTAKNNGKDGSGNSNAGVSKPTTYPLPPGSARAPAAIRPPPVPQSNTSQLFAMLTKEASAAGSSTGAKEVRREVVRKELPEPHPIPQQICRDFLRGVCRSGSACTRIHQALPAKQTSSSTRTSNMLPAAPPSAPHRLNLGQTQASEAARADRPHNSRTATPPQLPNRPAAISGVKVNDENTPPPSRHNVNVAVQSKKSDGVRKKLTQDQSKTDDVCTNVLPSPDTTTVPVLPSGPSKTPKASGSKTFTPVAPAEPAGKSKRSKAEPVAVVTPQPSKNDVKTPGALAATPDVCRTCRVIRKFDCYHPPPGEMMTESTGVTSSSTGKVASAASVPPPITGGSKSAPSSSKKSKRPEIAPRAPTPKAVEKAPIAETVSPPSTVAGVMAHEEQDDYDRSLSAVFSVGCVAGDSTVAIVKLRSSNEISARRKHRKSYKEKRLVTKVDAKATATPEISLPQEEPVVLDVATVDLNGAKDALSLGVGAVTVKVPHTPQSTAFIPPSQSISASVPGRRSAMEDMSPPSAAPKTSSARTTSQLGRPWSDCTDVSSSSAVSGERRAESGQAVMARSFVQGSSAQRSLNSSMSSIPSIEGRKPRICLDWRRGRCVRPFCKYSHVEYIDQQDDDHHFDRLMHKLEMSAAAESPSLTDECHVCHTRRCNGKHKAPEPRPSVGADRSEPVVPPGLGLESKILGEDAKNGPPRSPPKSAAVPGRREPPETIAITVLDASKVTFGPGFEVKQLRTGFESCQIILESIPHSIKPAVITEVLSAFGEVVSIQLPEHVEKKKGALMLVRATFAKAEEAALAVSELDGARLFNRTIAVRLSSFKSTSVGKGVVRDSQVLLEFPTPHKTGFVGYATEALAHAAIRRANGVELRDNWITAEMWDGMPKVSFFTVRFLGVPADMQLHEFDQWGENDGAMMDRANYPALRPALDGLRELLMTYGELVSFKPFAPPYKKQSVRVWAQFSVPSVADEVCRSLHNRGQRRFGDYRQCNNKLFARHLQSVSYVLPSDVFNALEDDIKLLRWFVYDNEPGSQINIQDSRQSKNMRTVRIVLESENMLALMRMKTAFERLLRGDQLVRNGEIVWHGFFGRPNGIAYLEDLQRSTPGVLINRDSRRRTLALFGPAPKRAVVRQAIMDKVAMLQTRTQHVFRIEQEIISLFIITDLPRLQRELGESNVHLDVWTRLLYVTGDEDSYVAATQAISRTRSRPPADRPRREVECPVCFDEVTAPIELKCGHTWCKACLANYLLSAVDGKRFPLKCLGAEDRCTHLIPVHNAVDVLSPNDFNTVVRAAFFAYVHARPTEFHYCPTPDCEQVYRSAPPGAALQCPSCLVRICSQCHGEAHDTDTCPEIEVEDLRLFEEWKSSHDVKNCPNCKAPIERDMGCNHMNCTRCKTHICWVCLATFARSEEAYEHMHATHGGIGL